MTRIQIQFPDPLYQRLKEIAEQRDWSLEEVMRKATEHFVTRFPENPKLQGVWRFPTLDCGGDFLTDPASLRPETDAILQRTGSWSSPLAGNVEAGQLDDEPEDPGRDGESRRQDGSFG